MTLILILTLYYQLADFLVHGESITLLTFLYVKVICIIVVIQLTSICALYHLKVNTIFAFYHNAITINEMYYVIVIVEFIVIVDYCDFRALLHIIIDISLN